ncbi:hypothetical protein MNB_SUP05-7-277 [hydrothermal vent metagenome]|uniref:Uncharacterized protein n=1 Tax=hydrothermal vent metagenome TaxID=652676 RepID=A0A1W1DV37_9ZZZZ
MLLSTKERAVLSKEPSPPTTMIKSACSAISSDSSTTPTPCCSRNVLSSPALPSLTGSFGLVMMPMVLNIVDLLLLIYLK